MAHPLDGCRAKILRAGDHLDALNTETRRFINEYPYRISPEQDADGAPLYVRLRAMRRPPADPPVRLSVIVGDAMHNLRSALDHLVWQLALIGDGPKERWNQFPIFDTPEKFEELCPRYLFGVRPEHRTEIKTYQPFGTREEGFWLSVLAHLSDVDKHRVIHQGARILRTGEGSLNLLNVTTAQITSQDWTRFEDGAELYRVDSWEPPEAKPQVDMKSLSRPQVIFGDDVLAGNMVDFLTIRNHVSNIVESFADTFDTDHAAPPAPLAPNPANS